MILQKIQAAILLDMSACLLVNLCRRDNWVSERQLRVVKVRSVVQDP